MEEPKQENLNEQNLDKQKNAEWFENQMSKWGDQACDAWMREGAQ